MSDFIDFFVWIIIGTVVALIGCFYEMLWLSPRGLDRVSQAKRDMLKYR